MSSWMLLWMLGEVLPQQHLSSSVFSAIFEMNILYNNTAHFPLRCCQEFATK